MHPDLVWRRDETKELWLFELTISYETVAEDSRRHKQAKYQEVVEAGCEAGYRTELITLEIHSLPEWPVEREREGGRKGGKEGRREMEKRREGGREEGERAVKGRSRINQ